TGIDVIAPGRQDIFLENHNPVFRSADISVAPLPTSSLIFEVLLNGLRSFRALQGLFSKAGERPVGLASGTITSRT
ncbi:MAG: hypothetical protein KAJ09_04905, partial [Deltaproteobacteria bacterium]|nr:hypothetical protein [Deltaproteobacteria bacterium]